MWFEVWLEKSNSLLVLLLTNLERSSDTGSDEPNVEHMSLVPFVRLADELLRAVNIIRLPDLPPFLLFAPVKGDLFTSGEDDDNNNRDFGGDINPLRPRACDKFLMPGEFGLLAGLLTLTSPANRPPLLLGVSSNCGSKGDRHPHQGDFITGVLRPWNKGVLGPSLF